mgnify:CR=1 FL=1
MITPLDIQKKQFSKQLRGLNEKEVQTFLQEVFQTLEKHINDNAEIKEKMSRNIEEIQKYRTIEKTLSETLIVAKRTAEDLMINARKEAEQIVMQAKLQAKAIEEQSKRDTHVVQSQRMMMEKDLEGFRLRMEGLLRAQLDVVSHYKPDVVIPAPKPQMIENASEVISKPEVVTKPEVVPKPEVAPITDEKKKPSISEFAQAQLDLSAKLYAQSETNNPNGNPVTQETSQVSEVLVGEKALQL